MSDEFNAADIAMSVEAAERSGKTIAPKRNRVDLMETKCKWCGKPTMMGGTHECDSCNELHRRIAHNPVMAAKIADALLDTRAVARVGNMVERMKEPVDALRYRKLRDAAVREKACKDTAEFDTMTDAL